MNDLLTFKVEIKWLEDKIWREIAIVDRFSLAYHLFEIIYKNKRYLSPKNDFMDDDLLAKDISLKSLNFKKKRYRSKRLI